MKRYKLRRQGNLLFLKAAVEGPAGIRILNLLVDTGSTYTILPSDILEAVGCSSVGAKKHVKIVTGSGHVFASWVKVKRFHSLGKRLSGFSVVAHTLPPGSFVDGLLGMDFLGKMKAVIDIENAIIQAG
jgi:aspartyl protease family protein